MKQDILVSVVIPTYSRNVTLSRAIDSVLQQTYQNLDIIVVDDNSEDSEWRKSTEDLMEKYAEEPRIRYIKNKQNLGGSGARNEGIKAARGEYIAFLDDDDEFFPLKVEKQLERAISSSMTRLALVFCDVQMLYGDGNFMCNVESHYKGCCLYEAIKDNCLASTSQWLAVKSALVDVGMFTDVPCKQDSTLILKLLEAGYEVDYVPEILLKYYFYDIPRISSKGMKNIEGELSYRDKCRKNYRLFNRKQIKEIEYSFWVRLYKLYKGRKMKKEEIKYLTLIMRAHPVKACRVILSEKTQKLKFYIHNKKTIIGAE